MWAGAVIAPTEQGECNSDFAFAVTTAMEGMHQIQTDLLYDFAEEGLIDCQDDEDDVCTNGRDMQTVLDSLLLPENAVAQNWNYLYEGI